MIHLFHGDNTFASWTEITKILSDKDRVLVQGDKVSDLTPIFFDSDNLGLFSTEPKTILIKRFFKNRKKSLHTKLVDKLSSSDIDAYDMYFWEAGKVDKRTKIYKYFKKHFKTEEFKLLKANVLVTWLVGVMKEFNINISSTTAREFIEKAGTDQQILYEECNKLSLYLKYYERDKVTTNDLQIISQTTKEKEIWDLLDFISRRDKKKSLEQINLIVTKPSDFPFAIIMIARQLRILYLLISKDIDKSALTKDLKLHPFVIQKASKYLYKFDEAQIKRLYNKIVDLDFAIKQGKIDAILGLNLFIASI